MWKAYNGILQGCGLSVVLLNCLTAVWARAAEEEANPEDGVQTGGYADDIHRVAETQRGARHVVDVTSNYAELRGQELSSEMVGKSYAFSAHERDRQWLEGLRLQGEPLPVRGTVELLGAEMPLEAHYGGQRRR